MPAPHMASIAFERRALGFGNRAFRSEAPIFYPRPRVDFVIRKLHPITSWGEDAITVDLS